MKKFIAVKSRMKYLLVLSVAALFWAGCAKDTAPVLYDEYASRGTGTPVITSISPAGEALAAFDTLTINGTNFKPDTNQTMVYFDKTAANIVSITNTEIKVKAPNLPKDSIQIRVMVPRASKISDPVLYKLQIVHSTFETLVAQDEPTAVTFDKFGNLYVSMRLSGVGVGVKKWDVNGVKTDYAPKGSEANYQSIKIAYGPYGANGQMFGARKLKAIFAVNPGAAPTAFVSSGVDGNIWDLDFDQNANMWAVGQTLNIFRIKADKTLQKFPIGGTSSVLRAVRVFNNYLYVGGLRDGIEGVWRLPINGSDLGAAELVFDFGSKYSGKMILGLNFSTDGTMLIGTDATATIVVVNPDQSYYTMLPGVLKPIFFSFTWQIDANGVPTGNLVYSREKVTVDETDAEKLLYARVLGGDKKPKTGAPYYGLGL